MQIKQRVTSIVLAMMLMMGVIFTTSQAQAVPLTQQWWESNAGPFDRIELYMMGDANNTFNPATTHVDSNSSWITQVVNPRFVSMTGPDVTELYFTTGFTDPATESPLLFQMDFAAFNGNSVVEAAWLTYNSGWDISSMGKVGDKDFAYDRNNYDTSGPAAPVPEPGTMLLMGSGMAALVIVSKRRKNAHAGILEA